jgi:hypothetical protein
MNNVDKYVSLIVLFVLTEKCLRQLETIISSEFHIKMYYLFVASSPTRTSGTTVIQYFNLSKRVISYV